MRVIVSRLHRTSGGGRRDGLNDIQAGFFCLRVLEVSGYGVFPTVHYEVGPCLMEDERHFCIAALAVEVEHPVIVKRPGIFA